MRPVLRARQDCSWIAPPRNGINNQPFDYEYVRFP